MSLLIKGATRLSALDIDVDKDWGGHRIENVGAPNSNDDVPRAQTNDVLTGRFGVDRLPAMTSGKLWLGTGGDVAEVDLSAAGLSFTELAPGAEHNVTNTNTWEDWDISGKVPTGTKYVIVEMQKTGGGDAVMGARKNGSTLNRKVANGEDVDNESVVDLITEVDANRVIEIFADSTRVDFYIVGYWS